MERRTLLKAGAVLPFIGILNEAQAAVPATDLEYMSPKERFDFYQHLYETKPGVGAVVDAYVDAILTHLYDIRGVTVDAAVQCYVLHGEVFSVEAGSWASEIPYQNYTVPAPYRMSVVIDGGKPTYLLDGLPVEGVRHVDNRISMSSLRGFSMLDFFQDEFRTDPDFDLVHDDSDLHEHSSVAAVKIRAWFEMTRSGWN